MIKRREFLALSSVASLYIFTGCGGSSSSMGSGGMGSGIQTPSSGGNGTPSIGKALPIPSLMTPTNRGGVNHYDLRVQYGQHSFFDGITTSTLGINGSYLGPTLLMSNGDNVSINYTNTIDEIITMHGHGMHVPPDMDGTAHQPIYAGDTWSSSFVVNQKASTNWYHPHTMGRTAEQVYKGLAGLIIVEDSESRSLDLPKRYGVDDIPLVLQDRVFTNGQINYSPSRMDIMRGYIGDTFIVNGAIEPTFGSEAKEVRFRVLNGSNSSVYQVGFSDGRVFQQIATDNAFLESPISLSSVILSPGERVEIIVDFSGAMGQSLSLIEFRYNKTFLHINIDKAPTAVTKLPNRLTTLTKYTLSQALRTRSFVLSGMMGDFEINGKSMNLGRIDERVPLGEVEIWDIRNSMMMDHNFHIHATHFMILDRNGNSNIAPNERGYKDVVYLPANGSVRVLVKMSDYANETVPYMYHCHFLEHEDAGMMGQFVVTR